MGAEGCLGSVESLFCNLESDISSNWAYSIQFAGVLVESSSDS